ncbi:polyphenol oxidase [Marchantia polymorpha subsp. ruderalis]|uniref:Tyrosinase copper-binding domain-containing protein n=2 Tax=Marchantia polymorpha TaxID=3197 RepID=A0AAF6B469_MARPO|nr:hypothetical protein MARPO_0121s0020 [Marchantia polymorpha]BBN06803.1 hypothetical protein Mp_3g24040 [Marchantia polymorpha subsp. ruderalis]|eukprot:PTQ30672.1 hypothetical protein MARPO_0121s0020 [Marchantia polymorpha]
MFPPLSCTSKSPVSSGFHSSEVAPHQKLIRTTEYLLPVSVLLKATARTGAEASEDSTDGDDDGDDATIEQSLLQRRQLLWGATGSLTWLSSVGLAVAKPIPPAIFSPKYCTDNIYPNQGAFPNVVEDCCLPDGSSLTPKDFVFEKLPMRTRKSAHVLSEDAAYVAKHNAAYEAMKKLPDSDPRSFAAQWHPGSEDPSVKLDVHGSWAFLPWHRMYLYFHERFLSDLIGDPTFALPFWNWDNQRPDAGGNKMPRMFVPVFFPGPLSNLQKAFRNTDHYPPEIVRLDRDNPGSSPKDVQVNNLVLMHRTVVSSTSDVTFLGSAYRANHDGRKPSAGSAENDGHNKIHVWTGSGDQGRHPFKEDMGTFVYAGRNPARARKESDDPDFLNAKFAFYDHKGEIVHVKVSQTLSTEDLSYKYEIMESDKDWINFEFQTVDEAKPSPEDISRYAETPAVFKKDESATFRLLRGEPVPFGRLAADEVEEILVIKGVKTPMRSFMAYKVFINLPDADPSTKLDTHNFVGMITNLPHNMSKAHSSSGVDFRLSIGASLKGLGPVSVTFVPAGQNEDAGFDGLEIKFN